MKVTLHIGLHFTGKPILIESLAANHAALEQVNTSVPSWRSYSKPIKALIHKLDGLPPIGAEEDALLAQIISKSEPKHLIMSDPNWASPSDDIFLGGMLYRDIGKHTREVTELFSTSDLRISLAVKNPAFFVSDAVKQKKNSGPINNFLRWADPLMLSWVDVVDKLQAAAPDIPITMWCEEDAALIWPTVLRTIMGTPPDAPIDAGHAALAPLLQPEGLQRFLAFIEKYPPKSQEKLEKIALAFLDKYATETALLPQCDVPTWSAETILDVTENYEEDIATLAARDNINFILPAQQPVETAVETGV